MFEFHSHFLHAWDLEIYPRTHMWFSNQLWCTGASACISNLNYAHKGDMFPLRTTSLLERSFGLQKLIPKSVPIRPIFLPQHGSTMTWHPCQVSWFSDVFWIYKNFKTKFPNVLGRAMMPRCFNFILISSMGPRNSPEDTNVIFQPTLVHESMCL